MDEADLVDLKAMIAQIVNRLSLLELVGQKGLPKRHFRLQH